MYYCTHGYSTVFVYISRAVEHVRKVELVQHAADRSLFVARAVAVSVRKSSHLYLSQPKLGYQF